MSPKRTWDSGSGCCGCNQFGWTPHCPPQANGLPIILIAHVRERKTLCLQTESLKIACSCICAGTTILGTLTAVSNVAAVNAVDIEWSRRRNKIRKQARQRGLQQSSAQCSFWLAIHAASLHAFGSSNSNSNLSFAALPGNYPLSPAAS